MSIPKEISDFMAKYGVLSDEIWSVRNGAYAIKHKALERVAAANAIELYRLDVVDINQNDKTAVVMATMKIGAKVAVSLGEAAPYNNKNAYPVAMAEKRAIDRCILKLLQTHGVIYSDSEADEFGDPDQGEKGTLLRSSQYAREEYKKLMRGIRDATSGAQLEEWAKAYSDQIRATPFKDDLRREYNERKEELQMSRWV